MQDQRLKTALSALGYERMDKLHCRSNLIHAILLFAAMNHDEALEMACETELASIREETARQPAIQNADNRA